jgi:hypothetical protein
MIKEELQKINELNKMYDELQKKISLGKYFEVKPIKFGFVDLISVNGGGTLRTNIQELESLMIALFDEFGKDMIAKLRGENNDGQ